MFGRKKIKTLEAQIADLKEQLADAETKVEVRQRAVERRDRKIADLTNTTTGLRQKLNELRAWRDEANKRTADTLRDASEEANALRIGTERGRAVLIEWRDSDPQFSEIIQEVIDEFDAMTTGGDLAEGAGQQALDLHFGLSRASWSVLPRVLLNQMPDLWKDRFARLMGELDAEFPHLPPINYIVRAKGANGRFEALPPALCDYRHPDREALKQWRK